MSSASKVFNLVGPRCSVADVAVAGVRNALDELPSLLLYRPGNTGVMGTLRAWRHRELWLAEALRLLDSNRRLLGVRLTGGGTHGVSASW